MGLPLFLRVFLLSSSLSLLAFALLPDVDMWLLVKLLALSLGITLIIPVLYPHLRGVRKGDVVQAVNAPMRSFLPIPFLSAFSMGGQFISLDNGRIGSRIKVAMPDGSWREALVLSYSGLFNPARVRLLEAEHTIKIL